MPALNPTSLTAVADALQDLANAVRNLLDDDAAAPRPVLTEYISTLTDPVPPTRPYGIGFVRRNMDDFRVLCANHHYELTLTGAIKGTSITQ